MDIKEFAQAAIVVLIRDVLEINVLIPMLVFDYSTNPNIKSGYYMYQNPTGTIITLNMNAIEALKVDNDMKTVIIYGFIHEIMHMYQPINSNYFSDNNYYTSIEDSADNEAIRIMRTDRDLIQKRLHFEINDVFLNGIERQLKKSMIKPIEFEDYNYVAKILAGCIASKIDIRFDYLYNFIVSNDAGYIRIIFPDGRNYILEEYDYDIENSLNTLINLIYLTSFKVARFYIDSSKKIFGKVNNIVIQLF